ncbi:MAG: rod shape-determining protein MreD [Chloroflexi bacterium RBG_16_48_8]|nr:MAG: rod shape-determining protein MreD [Chloroflexi bacterium RBG_16_48_8]
MAYLIGIPLLAILAILQSVIFNDLTLFDGRPDLILLAVVAWGINGRSREAMIWGLFGGLFLDQLSGLPLGTTAIILIVIAYLVSFTEGRFWEANFLMPMGVMILFSLLYYLFTLIILWLLGKPLDLSLALVRIILPSTFLNLILALPASQLIKSLSRLVFPPEVNI